MDCSSCPRKRKGAKDSGAKKNADGYKKRDSTANFAKCEAMNEEDYPMSEKFSEEPVSVEETNNYVNNFNKDTCSCKKSDSVSKSSKPESVEEAAENLSLTKLHVAVAILAICAISASLSTLLLYFSVAKRNVESELFGPVECYFKSENATSFKDCMEGGPTPCRKLYVEYVTSSSNGTALLMQYFHNYYTDSECSSHVCGLNAVQDSEGNYIPSRWVQDFKAAENSSCYLDNTKPGIAILELEKAGTENIVMSRLGAYAVLTVPFSVIGLVLLAIFYCFVSGYLVADEVIDKVTKNYIAIGDKYKRIPDQETS